MTENSASDSELKPAVNLAQLLTLFVSLNETDVVLFKAELITI